ncbi:MAG TPA: hypothetical protein VMZ53_12385 [Kofleriaceae bacterium]|nr:hypothetical protein [Kofleriaceae bacterium]
MRLAASVALVLAALATPARADGFFYGQSYGVSSARSDARPMMGESLQLRIQMGWRWGNWSVGPWFAGHLAAPREGAKFGVVGGEPAADDSDFESIGADVRYNAPIREHLSAYVRGGPRIAQGIGALDGYRGAGLGVGTGVQLTGEVRALGFLFAPLFFAKKGPRIHASLYLDQNVDWYRLSADQMPSLSMPLVGTSIGIGAGSYF